MSVKASQITSHSIVCWKACSCWQQNKHQNSALLSLESTGDWWGITGGFSSLRSSYAVSQSLDVFMLVDQTIAVNGKQM